jgi:protein-tyrosine phosphatase
MIGRAQSEGVILRWFQALLRVLLSAPMIRICFVCLGNICRSPTAEAVFQKMVEDRGLAEQYQIDSAGTASYHEGDLADARSREAAGRRGYPIHSRSRPFEPKDFGRFDWVLAMDMDNVRALVEMAPTNAARERVRLLRSFDPTAAKDAIVPDPYYGGPRGFDEVIDICERACRGLLDTLSPESKKP